MLSGHMCSTTHESAQISQKQDERNIYVIMKQRALPVITTEALWHSCTWAHNVLFNRMYICMYVCMYVCPYVCMYVCMYACMYVCICVYIYIYIHIYNIYIYIYIYITLPVNVIVRLPHPRSGDSQGQETFLAPSADKQIRNYDTECSNHHPSQSTLRSQGVSRSKMKW